MERRKFIGSLATASFAGLTLKDSLNGVVPSESSKPGFPGPKAMQLKGKADPRVRHWDVITIGNLSRNRYWGESEDREFHSVICTCTLINVENHHILVDPSLSDGKLMEAELNRRTGLKLSDIDIVFITHQHGDHIVGLSLFPDAKWLAGAAVAEGLNKSGLFSKKVEAAGSKILDTVEVIPTPGHTVDHQSLRFDYKGSSVFVAGDAVATFDFWAEKRMYFKGIDAEESLKTMTKIDSLADIIVPGHDNYFLNLHSA